MSLANLRVIITEQPQINYYIIYHSVVDKEMVYTLHGVSFLFSSSFFL